MHPGCMVTFEYLLWHEVSSIFVVQDRHNTITQHNGRSFITFSPKSFAVVVTHGFERLRHAGNSQQTVERERAEKFHAQHHRAVIAEDKLRGVDGHCSSVRTPKVRLGLGTIVARAYIVVATTAVASRTYRAPCNHRPRSKLNEYFFIFHFFSAILRNSIDFFL